MDIILSRVRFKHPIQLTVQSQRLDEAPITIQQAHKVHHLKHQLMHINDQPFTNYNQRLFLLLMEQVHYHHNQYHVHDQQLNNPTNP